MVLHSPVSPVLCVMTKKNCMQFLGRVLSVKGELQLVYVLSAIWSCLAFATLVSYPGSPEI